LWLLVYNCGNASRHGTPQGYSFEEAQKVFQTIAAIESATEQPWSGPLRSLTITDSEFNSYIAFRIETEKEEIMKELRLKFLKKNKIEGKVHIDLRGQDIPSFIRPEMDIHFAADVLTKNGLVKIAIKQLFLEGEPIQPLILDLVIAISARLNNEKATSLNDWYELPYGVKDIKTEKGKATFFY
jgi:hypothetical protein